MFLTILPQEAQQILFVFHLRRIILLYGAQILQAGLQVVISAVIVQGGILQHLHRVGVVRRDIDDGLILHDKRLRLCLGVRMADRQLQCSC